MGVIDILSKLGVLRYGAKTARGHGSESVILDEDREFKPHLRSKKQPGEAAGGNGGSGTNPTAGRTRNANPVGRQVFFWVALIIGVLSTLLVWAGAGTVWMLMTAAVWAGYLYFAKRFAFDAAYYPGAAAGLFAVSLVASIVFLTLGSDGVTTAGNLDTGTRIGLDYQDARLAVMQPDGSLNLLEGSVVPRGEKLAVVFLNVGKFKEGSDGRHWFDLDMELTGAEGNRIHAQEGILSAAGEGRQRLEGGIAKSPFTFVNTAMLEPGKYKYKVTIRDRIGTGHASATRAFEVK